MSENNGGGEALKLGRELSSRKLKSGIPLSIMVITAKKLPPELEAGIAGPKNTPFPRVILPEYTKTEDKAAIVRLRCDYDVQIWYHESRDAIDHDPAAPALIPAPTRQVTPQEGEDRCSVDYEMRKVGYEKVITRGSLPPLRVSGHSHSILFSPYPEMATEIAKKLNQFK